MKCQSLKVQILFLSIVAILTSCSGKSDTQLRVVVENLESEITLEIYRQHYSTQEKVGEQTLNPKRQEAQFFLVDSFEPSFYSVQLPGIRRTPITLLLDSADQALLTIDLNNVGVYSVEGSESSTLTKLLADRLRLSNRTIDSLARLASDSDNQQLRQSLARQMEAVKDSQRVFSTAFIWDHPRSYASIMALYQQYSNGDYVFDSADDHMLFKVVGSALQVLYPESDYTLGIIQDIKNQTRIISSHSIAEFIQHAEKNLPEIALPNPSGDTVRLSSLRGKVILLDFWASWHTESLMLNRELLEIYAKFNARGFEVYQVSLDFEYDNWVAAINSAALPWINVSELNPEWSTAAAKYNVTQLPANYLIDSGYDIVGRNIYGNELEAKLRELL